MFGGGRGFLRVFRGFREVVGFWELGFGGQGVLEVSGLILGSGGQKRPEM